MGIKAIQRIPYWQGYSELLFRKYNGGRKLAKRAM